MSISTPIKPKWHPIPPPSPSPKILNLPTRTHRKQPKSAAAKPPRTAESNFRGKLESLFDQEREFSRTFPAIVLLSSGERRERVEEREREKSGFQGEILRAECNFLKMDREFALKKLERNRVQMDRTLSSAVQTVVSGRKKIHEGKNVGLVLEEEIEDLAEKLEELQRSYEVGDFEVQNCGNFDKKASILQRRLEKLGGLSSEKCSEQIPDMAESSLSINGSHEIGKESFVLGCKNSQKSRDVEILGTKMEGLSKKGMLDRMEEEYGSMLSTTANSSAASSKRIEFPDSSSFSTRQTYQEIIVSHEENKCSGRCKAAVRRIVEQVRGETEQWSQMQEMLGQVREEMEELQVSRDFWEDRALKYDEEIQSLQSSVQEWRDKALKSETNANGLQTELCALKAELKNLRLEPKRVSVTPQYLASSPICKQLEKEEHMLVYQIKGTHKTADEVSKQELIHKKSRSEQDKEIIHKYLPPISLGKQLEKEKKCIYFGRVKENRRINEKCSKQESSSDGTPKSHKCSSGFVAHRRQVFQDIGNSAALVRQNGNGNAVLCMRCHEALKTEESL